MAGPEVESRQFYDGSIFWRYDHCLPGFLATMTCSRDTRVTYHVMSGKHGTPVHQGQDLSVVLCIGYGATGIRLLLVVGLHVTMRQRTVEYFSR